LINEREESALDLEEVFRVAKETGTLLEIDGAPERLDLDDVRVRRAHELGIPLSLTATRTHPTDSMVCSTARQWLGAVGFEARDVLNTLEWKELRKRLKRNRK